MPLGSTKSFLYQLTGLLKENTERWWSAVYFKPQNKFLFQDHCACVRDLADTELCCSFLHGDVCFPSVNKAAGPHSRRNSCMKLVKNEFLAVQGFCFVTYQYASNRMNATYLWFMPEKGDLPEEIHRRGLKQRKPAKRQNELLVFVMHSICDHTLPLPFLCKKIRLWVVF